ncbi:hypothetical protein M2140_001928 [Clostridiales Family XIII bacterium PM5-7]
MKVGEVLAHVNEVKPNPYTQELLLGWLNDIEAKIQTEALETKPEGVHIYELPQDLDAEMILPRPYDECYKLYVQAQIDFALQEFGTYNNTMQMFNAAFNEAKKYYVSTREKKNPLKIKVYL